MVQSEKKTRFTAGPLTFIVRHELWDGNIQDHADQGVAIMVAADVDGKQTKGYARDKSDTENSYEVGPAIQKALGNPINSTFVGAIYLPDTDQAIIDKDRCCNASDAPPPGFETQVTAAPGTQPYSSETSAALARGEAIRRAQRAPGDAVRLIQASSKTTGANEITVDLVTGISNAKDMYLRENPEQRLADFVSLHVVPVIRQAEDLSLLEDRAREVADTLDELIATIGPGQIGKNPIERVDKTFAAAAAAFAKIHGAAPSDWKSKATDFSWSYFYIAGYLAIRINDAESTFHLKQPVLTNQTLGVLPLGIAMYHGGFEIMKNMRQRIAKEDSRITKAYVTWDMVEKELRSGTADPKEMKLERYTQLVLGSWQFDFDITAALPRSRFFQIQDGKLKVTVLANYQETTASDGRGSTYRVRLRNVVMAWDEGTGLDYGSFVYNIGVRGTGTWTGLPKGTYYLVIEKIEDTFSPDHLIGKGTVKTIF